MNEMDDLIGSVEREIETLSNRISQPSTPKDIKDVAGSLLKTNVDFLSVLYAKRATRFGVIAQPIDRIAALEAQVSTLAQRLDAHESWASKFDDSPDTAVIPPETIAKANTPNDMRVVIETKDTPDGFTMNVRTHEKGTGYPIGQEFATGGTVAGPAPMILDERETVAPLSSFRKPNPDDFGHGC